MSATIDLDRLVVDPTNPRTDPGDIDELAASIADLGLQDPLKVRPLPDGRYGVYAGQRRLAALRDLGHTEAPCIVTELDDTAAAIAGAADQLATRQLNPIDEAETYAAIIEATGLTQGEVAAKLGVSQATVSKRMRLLDLPDDTQELVASGDMSLTAAYRLVSDTRKAVSDAARRRARPTDDVGVLKPLTAAAELVDRATAAAKTRGETVSDLVARAVRRELAEPSCKTCEQHPAMPGGARDCLACFQASSDQRPAPTSDPRCGSYAGYARHWNAGERPCEQCRDAKAAYERGNREASA